MIYLIGGSPKCGKTTVAKKLSEASNIPWVSTDTLQNIVKLYVNKKYFPVSNQRGDSNDEKYSTYTIKEIIDAYQQQAKTCHKAIDMFVTSEIINGSDFILEGYHITPELVFSLQKKFPKHIRSLFLIKTDTKKFLTDIKKSTTPHDWILMRTHSKETYIKIARMVCTYGRFLKRESKKFGFTVLNMDKNFNDNVKKAITYLTTTR